jgi:hypothetical protein
MACRHTFQVNSPSLAGFGEEDLLEGFKDMKEMLAGSGTVLVKGHIWTLAKCGRTIVCLSVHPRSVVRCHSLGFELTKCV